MNKVDLINSILQTTAFYSFRIILISTITASLLTCVQQFKCRKHATMVLKGIGFDGLNEAAG